ncbi:DUF3306 domain-containing protein [Falsiroseomonas tokyonensis]|uniref:DUF3306 domain-containing protein n=1 Tax=Falsiroseomonas tokyonensis TaxID=430521 RepID=A0ABV7BSP1_9PROT|nr:DUF3306 domain-containing protein [Falsiroseomonas tokyonensis]MBU8538559.1 DUF3306 domain-containing protein [Falsiroseomonas tokyonensis]
MSEDGFLGRWSRLKRAAEPAPEPKPEPEIEAEDAVALPQPAACPLPGVPEIDLSALPRIEELTESSDFSLFLRPGIPAALRGAALRRMWSLDPGIRDFIGPADYAWDYNNPAGMPPGFSLDLGGELKKLLAQAIGERPEEEAPEAEAAAETPAEPEAPPEAVAETLPQPEAAAPRLAEAPAAEPASPRRRHGGAMPA